MKQMVKSAALVCAMVIAVQAAAQITVETRSYDYSDYYWGNYYDRDIYTEYRWEVPTWERWYRTDYDVDVDIDRDYDDYDYTRYRIDYDNDWWTDDWVINDYEVWLVD